MQVKRVVERPDGAVVFQAVLEGAELAFVIENGIDAIFQMATSPFMSLQSHDLCDVQEMPDGEQ